MKKKNIIIIAGTILIVGILAVVGINLGKNSGKGLSDETLDLIQKNEQIEIEIAVPDYIEDEQGTQLALEWVELAYLNSYQDTIRTPIEKHLGIEVDSQNGIKKGLIYSNGKALRTNSTLKFALENTELRKAFDNDETISVFADAALNTFSDIEADEEMTNFYMAINAYFNLLPATEEGYANPQSALTRAEFMSLIMRAETPVNKSLKVDEAFKTAVGESQYNLYAQALVDYSYLNLSDKSLNNQTFNGNISRAEAIYILMNHYYADELKSLDISKAKLDDTKDGGDIAKTQGYTKDYGKSYEITYSINNPKAGVPTPIYKALVLAESKGLIDSETRFDEAITLEESVELLVNIYKTLPIDTETASKPQQGDIIIDHAGDVGEVGYNYGLTTQEILYPEDGDYVTGGTVYYNDDGTTYIIWNVGKEKGNIYTVGDRLPDGKIYTPKSEADAEIYWEITK